MRNVIGYTVDENKNFKFIYEDDSIYKQAFKDAQSLLKRYRLITMEIEPVAGVKSLDDLIFQAEFQRDSIEGGDDYNDDLEVLRDEGKTEGQIKRIQQTAIKALDKFISKYKNN